MTEIAAHRKVYSQVYTGLNGSAILGMLNSRQNGSDWTYTRDSETVITGPLVIDAYYTPDNIHTFHTVVVTAVVVIDAIDNQVMVWPTLEFADRYGVG